MFENGPSVASGVAAALKAQKREDIRVVAMGGDGSTFDIGFGALSGMLERNDDVLYICFDNGAYMNTGGQRSGATIMGAGIAQMHAQTGFHSLCEIWMLPSQIKSSGPKEIYITPKATMASATLIKPAILAPLR